MKGTLRTCCLPSLIDFEWIVIFIFFLCCVVVVSGSCQKSDFATIACVAAYAASVKDSNLTVNLNPVDFQAVWGANAMPAVGLIRACFAQHGGGDFAIVDGDCFLRGSIHNFLVLVCVQCLAAGEK